jgi:hypothetical protein
VIALGGDGEHGGRDVGADDLEAAAGEPIADDSRTARHVEHAAAAVDAGEPRASARWRAGGSAADDSTVPARSYRAASK